MSERKNVFIKSQWLKNFIQSQGGKLYVLEIATVVG